MITYPLPRFEQQKAEILQRYKILSGTDSVNTSPVAMTAALTFGVPIVFVALSERYRHWFRASHGVQESVHDKLQIFCAHASLSDTVFAVEDMADEPYFVRNLSESGLSQLSFFAGAPLRNPHGQRFGTLCLLDKQPRQFDHGKLALLESFAKLVSEEICLRSAGRYAVRDLVDLEEDKCSLYDLAMTDSLSGALNRRAFFHFAEREVRRSQRYGNPLSTVMLDIDHFKKVNDVHGHSCGDEVIKRVSKFVLGNIRDEDILGRIGGEEFCLVLPETSAYQAELLANRLRMGLKSHVFAGEGSQFSITVSMGISEPQADDKSVTASMERADKALYVAKNSGRDRVVVDDTATPIAKAS